MSFVKHLLFWPVTAPLFLTRFSLGKVQDAVREELTDESRIREDLLELQLRLELGEIDEGEYARREAELMAALREARRWRDRFGMPTRGGPVRVAGAGEELGAGGEGAGPGGDGEAG